MNAASNGRNPPAPRVLVGETSVVVHVMHFADGTAESALHVTYGGFGHLERRPRTLAEILHQHANEIAGGIIRPPDRPAGV